MNRKFYPLLGIVALLLAGFGWYYYQGPCGVSRVDKALAEFDDITSRWDRTFSLALSTSRIALSGPVAQMQAIQEDADDIQVPACLDTAKDYLLTAIDTSVTGMLAFMSQSGDNAVSYILSTANGWFVRYEFEADLMRECAPFCPGAVSADD